jgi:hypothetical protein
VHLVVIMATLCAFVAVALPYWIIYPQAGITIGVGLFQTCTDGLSECYDSLTGLNDDGKYTSFLFYLLISFISFFSFFFLGGGGAGPRVFLFVCLFFGWGGVGEGK